MISLADAQARLSDRRAAQLDREESALADALGRVAASDVQADLAIPPSDNSAMDGFAVRVADLNAAQPRLTVSQRIAAGSQPEPLLAATAARIFTGAPMPVGADAVVIQENCEFDTEQVTILKPVVRGANVRPRGQDIQCGARVIQQGQRLNAVDLSLLASIGKPSVEVFSRLKVAIFSTGDELVEPGEALKEGQIYNSNRPLLMSLCRQLGFEPIDCGIVADTLHATKQALSQAAQHADLILSSGGVSVGEEDHVKPAVEALGSLDMWKVQMKPGKPVAYGEVAGTPFLGLPGNPVSSFVVFQLLGLPLMRRLQGQLIEAPISYTVKAGFTKKLTTREEYLRVKLATNDAGELVADCFPNLSSGVLSSLSWANGLVRHDVGQSIETGQSLAFYPLRDGLL